MNSGQASMTLWSCQLCGFSSWLGHVPGTDDEAVIAKIHEVHQWRSPDCQADTVSVRPPAIQAAHIYYVPSVEEHEL